MIKQINNLIIKYSKYSYKGNRYVICNDMIEGE